MSRQQRLVLDTPVELSAIIDEGALRREVGGPDVMRVLGVSDMVAGASLTAAELPGVAWHISTRSGSGSGNCVEAGTILDGSGRFAVRHSHHPDSHVLVYASVDWAAFLAIIRAGRLN